MKQVFAGSGGITVEEVPAPAVERGTVLVVVDHSCISPGTELSGVRHAESPLWRRAVRDPAKVKKAVAIARGEGVGALQRRLREATSTLGNELGYSAAGTVVEVGEGIDDLLPGDRVACAGAGVANHAEVIRVPRNLCVPVPDGLPLDEASTVTLGAIALQGVRRAAPTLGETFVVLGLGAIGQLTVQLLGLHGCRVLVSDVDRSRVDLALELGGDAAIGGDGDAAVETMRLTDGVGADGVLITASTPSDEVVSRAFSVCRKKGRVVLVGDVGLNLRRDDIYAKELDFLVSTSYGPGRYDRRYEEDGLDYPIGHVRWTENRNMAEIVRLLAERRLAVGPLVSRVVPLERAAEAYAAFDEAQKPLLVLLRAGAAPETAQRRVLEVRSRGVARSGDVRVALIGPGGFARAVHLPNLRTMPGVSLRAVAGRRGSIATALAREFGATYATTDVDAVFSDPDVDAVVVTTRHVDHPELVVRALEAGKHVLVEKPLAISRAGLGVVEKAVQAGDAPVLLTGFNRRFSPAAELVRRQLEGRTSPAMLTYVMNAGYIPPDSWVHGPEGGGRNVGEACHVYDLFTYLLGAEVDDVSAAPAVPSSRHYLRNDNFVATITFRDGSVATLLYTALGSSVHPKERLTAFAGGTVTVLDDYREVTVTTDRGVKRHAMALDKGHVAELASFVEAVRTGAWPIPLWQQVQATDVALRVEEAIAGGGD